MRPGYVLANVRFNNPERARAYGQQVPATIAQYGGCYLARGGTAEQIEGVWPAHYLTLLAFPSLEQAKHWYASAEYGAIRSVRWANAESQLIFFEGVDDAAHEPANTIEDA
jgi:uncharacterized protein (DUF1330 family)